MQAQLLFHEPGQARNLRIEPKGGWLRIRRQLRVAGKVIKGSFVRSLDPPGTVGLVDRHNFAVQSLGILDTGQTLVHRDLDQTLRFWDAASRAPARTLSTLSSERGGFHVRFEFQRQPGRLEAGGRQPQRPWSQFL